MGEHHAAQRGPCTCASLESVGLYPLAGRSGVRRMGSALRLGRRMPLSAGNGRVLLMDSPLSAASEYVLGLRRMDGIFSACEDNTLLGRGHIGRCAFRRPANRLWPGVGLGNGNRRLGTSLRNRDREFGIGLGNRDWGFGSGKDDPFLGRHSTGYRAGSWCAFHRNCLGRRTAACDNDALLGWGPGMKVVFCMGGGAAWVYLAVDVCVRRCLCGGGGRSSLMHLALGGMDRGGLRRSCFDRAVGNVSARPSSSNFGVTSVLTRTFPQAISA